MEGLDLGVLAVVLAAAAVQGTVGFGMNVIAAPVLLAVSPELVPAPLLIAHMVLVGLMVSSESAHTDRRVLSITVQGAIPGTVAGLLLLSVATQLQLTSMATAVLLVTTLLAITGYRIPQGRPTYFTVGLVAGLLGATVSMNGPPLAVALRDRAADVRRGTLAAFLAVATFISLLGLAATGHFGSSDIGPSLALGAAAALGYGTSLLLRPLLDRHDPRWVIVPVAAASFALSTTRMLDLL